MLSLPSLQATVKDPIPDVRATAAKALGKLNIIQIYIMLL
jgi:HEAT repeat